MLKEKMNRFLILGAVFTFTTATYGRADDQTFRLSSDSDVCLGLKSDEDGALPFNGLAVLRRACNKNSPGQAWIATTTKHGVLIRSATNNKCLTVSGGSSKKTGTKIQLWDCLGDNHLPQLWQQKFLPDEKFHLVSAANGMALSISPPKENRQSWAGEAVLDDVDSSDPGQIWGKTSVSVEKIVSAPAVSSLGTKNEAGAGATASVTRSSRPKAESPALKTE